MRGKHHPPSPLGFCFRTIGLGQGSPAGVLRPALVLAAQHNANPVCTGRGVAGGGMVVVSRTY
jgi:hypothetical protein